MSTEVFLLINAAVVAALCLAAVSRGDGREPLVWSRVWAGYATGLLIASVCYLLPAGLDSIEGRESFQPRYFIAAGLALIAALWISNSGERRTSYPSVALLSLLGAATPPLGLVLLLTVACSGEESCLT